MLKFGHIFEYSMQYSRSDFGKIWFWKVLILERYFRALYGYISTGDLKVFPHVTSPDVWLEPVPTPYYKTKAHFISIT